MKISYLTILFMSWFFGQFNTLMAITCTNGDYQPALCDLPEYPGTRCKNAEKFRMYCTAATDGCAQIPGGCFGMVPPGHWYPIVEGEAVRWKCRCGCFGEETVFQGSSFITGRELIQKKAEDHYLLSFDDFDGKNMSLREINTIMHSEEKTGVRITTNKGREIILSEAHPVALADIEGHLLAMVQAKQVVADQYMMASDGPDQVKAVATAVPYGKEMMNFNVKSNNPENHIVIANELFMGDSAWQERLSSVESRILYRAEILKSLNKRQPIAKEEEQ